MAKDIYRQSPSDAEILGQIISELPDINTQPEDVFFVKKIILLTATDENLLSGEIETNSWECTFIYEFKKSICKTYWVPNTKDFLNFEESLKNVLN